MTRRTRLLLCCFAAAVLLAPGWRARLLPVPHEQVLAAARGADPSWVFGVSVDGARRGEQWHAQYTRSPAAALLRRAGMGASLTALVAPQFAAHIPAGADRADGYFRVESALRWPWWWPGGGVRWRLPEDASAR